MAGTCAKCNDPLVVEIDLDDEMDTNMAGGSSSSPPTVPDDVHLPCDCHIHWDCLTSSLDESTGFSDDNLGQCPACSQRLLTTSQQGLAQILVVYHNEGGVQRDLDVLPILREEAYCLAHPNERKARAFLELCREGDHRAVAGLLMDDEDDDEESVPSPPASEILRYQDPLAAHQSALHAAVANGHREVTWLLLLIASELSELEIPALVYQEAASIGIMRQDQTGKVDIRSLRDSHGRSAEDVAQESGVIWHGWVGTGRLTT